MAKTLEQLLGAATLTGLIQEVVSGVPDDLLPAGFWPGAGNTDVTEGNVGAYDKVEGTRQTARIVAYGSASQKRNLTGVSRVPVTLLHTFEHIHHDASVLASLMAEGDEGRQRLGEQTVGRQVGDFAQLFRNLRVSAAYSALCLGAVYFDGQGNLLPSGSGAKVTVDYGVPAANKNQAGGIIAASWATETTDIPLHVAQLKKAARKATGYPLALAFYGENIPSYFAKNNFVKELIHNNDQIAGQFARGEIPSGLMGLEWRPLYEAFYRDAGGTNRDWMAADALVVTPVPDSTWWGWMEGTFPVPTSLNISRTAVEALRSLAPARGAFSYAEITTDPPGIKHLAGDTFIPLIKVPGAIYQLDVTP